MLKRRAMRLHAGEMCDMSTPTCATTFQRRGLGVRETCRVVNRVLYVKWLLLILCAASGPSVDTIPKRNIKKSLMSSRRACERGETCRTSIQGALAAWKKNCEDFMM
ncbi:hypothetical protein IG631_22921 [Alternaria alternata]|nr:hypothetical protein IG631_22921 [Alternaria alternata]